MTPVLPTWVQKHDGRREAFDADKISQSLYAATEAIGSPNAFLARELTDGIDDTGIRAGVIKVATGVGRMSAST